MTKTKILTISVVCLALLNIVLIAGILIGGPKHHMEPKRFIIEKLEFTPSQVLEYENLMVTHRAAIDVNDGAIRKLKKELFGTLKTNDENKQQEILDQITKRQQAIELVHLDHFKEIKKVCKPEQIEKFNKLIDKLPRLFAFQREKQIR